VAARWSEALDVVRPLRLRRHGATALGASALILAPARAERRPGGPGIQRSGRAWRAPIVAPTRSARPGATPLGVRRGKGTRIAPHGAGIRVLAQASSPAHPSSPALRRTRHPVLPSDATFIMSTSPKIIPFRVLLRLFPRAIALLHRIVAARAAKWVARTEAARRPAPPPASQPELTRDSAAV
jgi:hypothetical protein